MDKDVPRAHHDLGGVSKFMCEPVDVEPHALTDFDKEVDALRQVLGMKRVMTVDELRRGIEAIPEADYHRLSYYQRWIRSITDNLLAKGVITEAELRAALEAGLAGHPRLVVVDTRDTLAWTTATSAYGRRGDDTIVEFTSLYEDVFDRVALAHEDARELIESAARAHLWYDALKRAFDIVLAALLALLALPFILAAALVLSLE
ncbi:MAG TPA: hypothetical protein VFE12_17965, partial [Acetobacteraceae bacterium]|nr:hypothetical protein [Acetobacteraceae bacterium]